MNNKASKVWQNKRKRNNKQKIIPLHYQKRSSSSSFHLSSFPYGGNKHKLKTVYTNNNQLAVALQNARCELSVKEHQIQEYAKETFNNKLGRIKVLEVATNLKKMVADLNDALQLLGLNNTTRHLDFASNNIYQHDKYENKMETLIESQDETPDAEKDTTELEADHSSVDSVITGIAACNLPLNMASDICEETALGQKNEAEQGTEGCRSSTFEPSVNIDGSPSTPKLKISNAKHIISLYKNTEENENLNKQKSMENSTVYKSVKVPKMCQTSKIPRLQPAKISHTNQEEDKSRRMTFVIKPGDESDTTKSKISKRKTFVIKKASSNVTTLSSDCFEEAACSLSSSQNEPVNEIIFPQVQKMDLSTTPKVKLFRLDSENGEFYKKMKNIKIPDEDTLSCRGGSFNNEKVLNLLPTNTEKDLTNVERQKDQGNIEISAQNFAKMKADDIIVDAIIEKNSHMPIKRPKRKSSIKSYEIFFPSVEKVINLVSAAEEESDIESAEEVSIRRKNISKLDRKRKVKSQRFSNKSKKQIVIADHHSVSLNTDNTNSNISGQTMQSENTDELHEQDKIVQIANIETDDVSNKNKNQQLNKKTGAQVALSHHDSKSLDDNVNNQTVISLIPAVVLDKCCDPNEIAGTECIKNSFILNTKENKDFSDKATDSIPVLDFPTDGKKIKCVSFNASATIIDSNKTIPLYFNGNDERNVCEQENNSYIKDTLDGCENYADTNHCTTKLGSITEKNWIKGVSLENSDDCNIANSIKRKKPIIISKQKKVKNKVRKYTSKQEVLYNEDETSSKKVNKMEQQTSKREILCDEDETSPKRNKTEKKENPNNIEKCIDNVHDVISTNEIKDMSRISQNSEDFQMMPFDDNTVHLKETSKCLNEKTKDLSSCILSGKNTELLKNKLDVDNFAENNDNYLKSSDNPKKKKKKNKAKKSIGVYSGKNTIIVHAEIHDHPDSVREMTENNFRNLQPSVVLNDVFNTKNKNCPSFCFEKDIIYHENSKISSKTPLSCNTFNVPSISYIMHKEISPEDSDSHYFQENEPSRVRSRVKNVSYKEPGLRKKLRR